MNGDTFLIVLHSNPQQVLRTYCWLPKNWEFSFSCTFSFIIMAAVFQTRAIFAQAVDFKMLGMGAHVFIW